MKELVRIANTDVRGNHQVFIGLGKIHGIGEGISHAICAKLDLPKSKKVGELTDQEIKNIDALVKDPTQLPAHLLNRRHDVDTGKDRHLTGVDLKLRVDFDIRKMKKLKTYKGVRHVAGQPVRGQRTKSHFRTGSSVGVMKKRTEATKIAAAKQDTKKGGK